MLFLPHLRVGQLCLCAQQSLGQPAWQLFPCLTAGEMEKQGGGMLPPPPPALCATAEEPSLPPPLGAQPSWII